MNTKTILYASEEHCLYCNEIIPEGRMICPICEEKLMSIRRGKKDLTSSARLKPAAFQLGIRKTYCGKAIFAKNLQPTII